MDALSVEVAQSPVRSSAARPSQRAPDCERPAVVLGDVDVETLAAYLERTSLWDRLILVTRPAEVGSGRGLGVRVVSHRLGRRRARSCHTNDQPATSTRYCCVKLLTATPSHSGRSRSFTAVMTL